MGVAKLMSPAHYSGETGSSFRIYLQPGYLIVVSSFQGIKVALVFIDPESDAGLAMQTRMGTKLWFFEAAQRDALLGDFINKAHEQSIPAGQQNA